MEQPIITALKKKSSSVRFHMPGHKGKLRVLGKYPFLYDFTEVDGLDNLLLPMGAIARSQELCAKEIGADAVYYSVNGSSAGILAAVLATIHPGEEILVGRDTHVSVLNAVRLSGGRPVFIEYSCAFGEQLMPCSEEETIAVLKKHPHAKAILLNYMNYYGMRMNIERIEKLAHERGMVVILDAAHGAHLPYSQNLPKDAGAAGADIWITSAHKTLPASNQCALLCAKGKRVDLDKLKDRLNMVQTTSPSYLLLASLDYARGFMAKRGAQAIRRQLAMIEQFKSEMQRMQDIIICKTDDPTRIVIDVSGRGISGFEAERVLREKGIEIECSDENHLILISTVFDTPKDFRMLARALDGLPKGEGKRGNIPIVLSGGSNLTGNVGESEWKKEVAVKAIGKAAAKHVLVYPPGIPVLLAGERITEEKVSLIEKLDKRGYNLVGYHRGSIVIQEEKI